MFFSLLGIPTYSFVSEERFCDKKSRLTAGLKEPLLSESCPGLDSCQSDMDARDNLTCIQQPVCCCHPMHSRQNLLMVLTEGLPLTKPKREEVTDSIFITLPAKTLVTATVLDFVGTLQTQATQAFRIDCSGVMAWY